jgi:hypothetical protein
LTVALRIVFCPPPQIRTRILHRPLRFPAKLSISFRRIRREVENIACTTLDDFVGQIATHGFGEGFDDVEDGAAAAGAKVPSFNAGILGAEVIES